MHCTAKRCALLAIFALLLVSAGWSELAPRQEVRIQVHEVAGAVRYLEGRGGNIGLSVGEDGVLMIDDQFAELAPRIEQAIRGLAEEMPRFLVNTHWHPDHVGGNPHFGRSATILAHANVRRRLAGAEGMQGRVSDPPMADVGLPVVTHEHGMSIHFNGEEIRLLDNVPGHTDGDTVVWFTGSKVVHTGDLYVNNGYPYVDRSSGGTAEGFVASANRLLELLPDDVKIIPGHGSVASKSDLREFRDMLSTAISRVRKALGEGKSADDMVAEDILSDLNAKWGQGSFMSPERFVRILAEDLSQS